MPDWRPEILRRLAPLKLAPTREAEIAEELAQHLDDRYEELLSRGEAPESAQRVALEELRGEDLLARSLRPVEKGHYREPIAPGRATGNFLSGVLHDIRYAFRMLHKSPGFTSVAILTLALGIGANTAIFSMLDWLVLRPIAGVKDPGQLTYLGVQQRNGGYDNAFSYPNFEDIRRLSSSVFSDVSAIQPFTNDGLNTDGKTMQMWTTYVTGNYFEMLGARPAAGRLILSSDASGGSGLVLSYSFWKSRFGGDPKVLGSRASVNGFPVTIVGVAQKGFRGALPSLDTQGYLPLGMATATLVEKKDFFANRGNGDEAGLMVVARLKPGVTEAIAQSALNVIAWRMARQFPKTDDWKSILVHKLTAAPPNAAADPSQPLFVISGLFLFLAGMVLLLACVNVANLQLMRASVRSREMAVRAALGAGRGRLMRQMLTESNLLALLSCAGGIGLGIAGSRVLSSLNLHTGLPIALDLSFNWRVLSYVCAAALLTGVVVGFVPAMRASRRNLSEVLHEGGRTATGGRHRLRSILVVGQVAGSLMLLIVTGLFVRSLQNVRHTNLGFDPSHVLDISMDPHQAGYNEAKGAQFFRDLTERVRALPSIQSASIAGSVPMGLDGDGAQLKIPGYESSKSQDAIFAGDNAVSPGYFETMGIPLIEGRDFHNSDGANAPRVAIVNEAMARKYWPGQDPVGLQFLIVDDPAHPVQIIGVVRNSVTRYISETILPYFYLPFAQKYMTPATLQLRTQGPPESMASSILGIIRSIEPAMPTFDVKSMTHALDTPNGLMLFELGASLAATLGTLGLVLAIVGVYGVVSYAASQRTHEIGVRMALGARPGQVLKLIFRQGFVIVGTGIAVGVFAAAAMTRLLGSFIVGVSSLDPLTFISASLLLAAIAFVASYVPARRAMHVDPMVALRYE